MGITNIRSMVLLLLLATASAFSQTIHVWEKVEIVLTSGKSFANPYTDVDVWVLLTGPAGSGFTNKQVWGFWDGGKTFKVRVLGTVAGTWAWTSGASVSDTGLTGKTGSFTTVDWTEAEKTANPNRRGIVRTAANAHALEYPDGTPFFFLADTWYAGTTWRYPYTGGITIPPDYIPGEANWSFEGGIQWLKRHGFNSIAMIACFPDWIDDNLPAIAHDRAGKFIRDAGAWTKAGATTVKNMQDESGNRPFMTPGKCVGTGDTINACADLDRINPLYFQSLDKKFDYLSENGFVPCMESMRRDVFEIWKSYHQPFNVSFCRYLNYLRARYGTYNMIFSLVHYDWTAEITATELKSAFDFFYQTYSSPPFSQPVTAMMVASTLQLLGPSTPPYLTIHATGNFPRDHGIYPSVASFFNLNNPKYPGYNNEPYYPAHQVSNGQVRDNGVIIAVPPAGPKDLYFARAQMYGNVLSGGLAGHVYGSGSFGGDSKGEPAHSQWPKIWTTLNYAAIAQAGYMRSFILSEGKAYQAMVVADTNLTPRRSPNHTQNDGLDGWAYMMRTPDKKIAFLYFENDCVPNIVVSGMTPNAAYRANWYNTWTGEWLPMGGGTVSADASGKITLPSYPTRPVVRDSGITGNYPLYIYTVNDWAAKLVDTSIGTSAVREGLGWKHNCDFKGCSFSVTRYAVVVTNSSSARIDLDIVSASGKIMRILCRGTIPVGVHFFPTEKQGLARGVYLLRLRQGAQSMYKKLFSFEGK